ncbi:MAG: RNA helicase [Flavobacterium sp. BFFFF1]|uniref:DEAD/DEAH box helicase n=1 Tax=unclassified Flavobacterium TaxID=196869 RepID=UPI000BD526E4|nr:MULTISPECIES: DEAD/DEAH box helicase [unclassified Flavobacterium]OYU80339.1 MAG: RNA helicase [Flavobacterium sp. BFFFF1]
MELKKINPNLQRALAENGLLEANEIQSETFSAIKSGADVVVQAAAGAGKTTTLVINVIQKLEKAVGESTRALILAENKDKVIEMASLFRKYGNYTDLRVFGVHEKGDIDFDKNHISDGLDILIGTPNKINLLFSTAGFNLNTVKLFVVDDADKLFKSRMDAVVQRLSMSIEKTQRIFFTTGITEKIEIMADKIMIEPFWFETDDE